MRTAASKPSSPEVVAFFENQGALPGGTKTEDFGKLVQATTRNWAPVAAKAKIEKQ